MSDFEDLEKLIRLKRYETPPKDYYERFYADFQARQRSEMLRQSAHGLFFERISVWLWGLGNRRWLYAGGAAYAAVMIVVFLKPMSDKFAPSDPKAAVTIEAKIPIGAKTGDSGDSSADPNHENDASANRPPQGGIREL